MWNFSQPIALIGKELLRVEPSDNQAGYCAVFVTDLAVGLAELVPSAVPNT